MAVETVVAPDASEVAPSTTDKPKTDDLDAPLPEGTKEETARRFTQLLDDRKTLKQRLDAYEAQGSPEEIAALKQQVQHVDVLTARINQLEGKRDPGEPKTEEQKSLETARRQAKTELRQIDDGIGKGEAAAQMLDGMLSGLEEDALSATGDILKEYGIPLTDQSIGRWSRRIAATIQEDPKLKRLYFRDPEAAVRKGFELELAEAASLGKRKTDAKTQTDKEKLAGLPKPHGGGGGVTGAEKPKAPQTSREGIQNSLAILRGQER